MPRSPAKGLTRTQVRIHAVLAKATGPLTLPEIASQAGCSWHSAWVYAVALARAGKAVRGKSEWSAHHVYRLLSDQEQRARADKRRAEVRAAYLRSLKQRNEKE